MRAEAEKGRKEAEESAMAESAAFDKALASEEERRLSEVSLLRSELESERKRRDASDAYAQGLRAELREETAALREQLAGESSRCIEIARRAENEVGCLWHCGVDEVARFFALARVRDEPRSLHFNAPCPLPNSLTKDP